MAEQGNIAQTVPLSAADTGRQEVYGEMFGTSAAEQKPDVVDADKQNFVRALLGDKAFEKTYTLFGQITAVYRSRTGKQTEKLYEILDRIAAGSHVGEEAEVKVNTPELWQLWHDRFMLASSLSSVKQTGLSTKNYPDTDNFVSRVNELLTLPQPIFQALLQASRDFESLVTAMTDEAQNPDFWPAGGSASPAKRMSPAPSTTQRPVTAGA